MTTRGASPSRRQPAPKKRSVWEELLIAKGKLRAISRLIVKLNGHAPGDRFISLCSAVAGRGSIVYALDTSGQVWTWDYKMGVWRPVSMTRGVAAPATLPGGE